MINNIPNKSRSRSLPKVGAACIVLGLCTLFFGVNMIHIPTTGIIHAARYLEQNNTCWVLITYKSFAARHASSIFIEAPQGTKTCTHRFVGHRVHVSYKVFNRKQIELLQKNDILFITYILTTGIVLIILAAILMML